LTGRRVKNILAPQPVVPGTWEQRRSHEAPVAGKVTIDDPGAYSRPWTVTFMARLQAPGDELMEYICRENNQYGIAGGHPNPFAQP